MGNILVSACLLGMNCRYNGVEKENRKVKELLCREGIHLIPICPEQMGGLTTPRDPSEIQQNGSIRTKHGKDVTEQYQRGAQEALKMAKLYHCSMAILKERSPACGCGQIYDGTFTGTLIEGNGIASDVLLEHGIKVFGESQLEKLLMEECKSV